MLHKNRNHITRWAGIPKSPGIYFIFSESLDILYVGYSNNLWNRMRNHGSPSQPFSESVQAGLFSYLATDTRESAQALEAKILLSLRRITNTRKLFKAEWPKRKREGYSLWGGEKWSVKRIKALISRHNEVSKLLNRLDSQQHAINKTIDTIKHLVQQDV
jgi:hypothetical protein